MRRGVVIAFAILGLAACGQQKQSQNATGGSEAAKPDVSAAAAPAAANPAANSCLDLVGIGNYEQAVPVCTAALDADAANEKVKAALETAKAKIAEMAQKASSGAADAAEGAADAAKDAAEDAKDAAPAKTY